MDASTVARLIAVGRLGLGAGLTVVPGVFGRVWLGADGTTTAAKVLGAGFGARDVAIGGGLWHALENGADARPWLLAGAAGDAADLLATLAARRSLPLLGRTGVVAFAASGAALSVWAARQLAP
ncbi:hypothetical protein OJ997_05265 [Solirubrobacter phytolaccae]|uniref:DUF4267 domain-containing protein n=1 Tax=Solirubrobacter phytolaccae TaxID=1404360 RepID=A0A9X3N4P6_9ACTN|nr:hypothetical protein [Solirubrobacter phytolaccae]MDA0179693.1 hypothetical protein [Solirubrobacter phytolaccae]